MEAPSVEALVFDFDGVIVDSVQLKVDAFLEMYQGHGPDILEQVEHYQRYHGGISRTKKFEYFETQLLGKPAGEDRITALAKQYSQLVEEKVVACPAVPGALAFLQAYAPTIPCYVISGTPEAELLRIADRRDVRRHFRIMKGSPKSKEQAIREFLDDGPYNPARVYMIGDAMTDHDAAKATDIGFIGVAPQGVPNFFPNDTTQIEDLTGLAGALRL